ncbi:DUF1330 domain-containing protein [Streptomyces sp. VRA16 Mangrove soil]|uniref:DUF1330 domain-containing protein n=1 Tax=Streptomyces sp. VRA16 Mangrove soil TaxID=2817434 RepID=UPI001A9DD5FE|nr:DUF1330 domain-containing protein [Streptomyces sp. VRA16 Mangrove soil]MBO1334730.1 DUF1330 domain-containing protein [Streptomyces sp. VRA16 Mangrove soil]
MTAYVIAVMRPTSAPHPDVATYIERVEATFAPYGGRFLVHGAQADWAEGPALGDVVVVEFPDAAAARAWYASPAYQEILPLRADHLPGSLVFLDGVPDGYDPARTAAALRSRVSGAAAPRPVSA